jgi:hypothetical protein
MTHQSSFIRIDWRCSGASSNVMLQERGFFHDDSLLPAGWFPWLVRLMHLPNCSPILQAIYTNSNSKAAAIRLENRLQERGKDKNNTRQSDTSLGLLNLDWSVSGLNRPETDGWVLYRACLSSSLAAPRSGVLTAAAACEAPGPKRVRLCVRIRY